MGLSRAYLETSLGFTSGLAYQTKQLHGISVTAPGHVFHWADLQDVLNMILPRGNQPLLLPPDPITILSARAVLL